jgi:hypothetical protein
MGEVVGQCAQAIRFARILLERNACSCSQSNLAHVSLKEASIYIDLMSHLIKQSASLGDGQQLHSYE